MLVRSKLQFNLKRYSNSVSEVLKRDLVSLPVVDISNKNSFETSKQVFDAFSTYGAFVAVNTNVKSSLQNSALSAAESFFYLPVEEKEKLHVKNGGIAWRGWMPFGGEYTHGKLDHKEGLYLGPEHSESDPHMGTPLYGKNLFPSETVLPNFRHTSLEYIQEIEKLGHRVIELTSLGLKLDADHIHKHYTYDSLSIVRMFYYPHNTSTTSMNTNTTTTDTTSTASSWGIGEHSDYGLLTMLISDSPGLQFFHNKERVWFDAPQVPGGIIVNCGDVMDRMTGGRFISPMHRAKNVNNNNTNVTSNTSSNPGRSLSRISIPFFFDPSWTAKMNPLPLSHLPPLSEQEHAEATKRWNNTSIVNFDGAEYSTFLAKKVSKIFSDVIPEATADTLTSTKGPSTRFAIKIPIK